MWQRTGWYFAGQVSLLNLAQNVSGEIIGYVSAHGARGDAFPRALRAGGRRWSNFAGQGQGDLALLPGCLFLISLQSAGTGRHRPGGAEQVAGDLGAQL
jgi:hypothetical protein